MSFAFFSSPLRCQVFCPLRLTLEGCATNMEPNTYRKISHGFSLRCFGFRNLHSFFEGNEGFSGRITQNGQVLTFFFGYRLLDFFIPSPARLTWNLQEPRLKSHLGSRLNFKSPLNSRLQIALWWLVRVPCWLFQGAGRSPGSVWARIGSHASPGTIPPKKPVARPPGPHHRPVLVDPRNSMQLHARSGECTLFQPFPAQTSAKNGKSEPAHSNFAKAPDPPRDPSAARQHRPHPPDQRHDGDPAESADEGPTSRPMPRTRSRSRPDPENP